MIGTDIAYLLILINTKKIESMRRIAYYIAPIVLCFIVGWVAMFAQHDALIEWYPLLNKPSITPPNWVFPIAWSIIYICMGLSIGRLIDIGEKGFIGLWFLQLVLNFLWSPMFFMAESPISGLAVILLLDVAVFSYTILSWRISKLASLLFMPYMLWLCLATYLNAYIYLYN